MVLIPDGSSQTNTPADGVTAAHGPGQTNRKHRTFRAASGRQCLCTRGKHDSCRGSKRVTGLGTGAVSSRDASVALPCQPFGKEDANLCGRRLPHTWLPGNVPNYSETLEAEDQRRRSPASLLGPANSTGAGGRTTLKSQQGPAPLGQQGYLRNVSPSGRLSKAVSPHQLERG